MDPNFEPLRFIGFNDHDPPKAPKFKYRHDGARSFKNFALIISHTWQLTIKIQNSKFKNLKIKSQKINYDFFEIFIDLFMILPEKKIIKNFSEIREPSTSPIFIPSTHALLSINLVKLNWV
jgi:hypothetical protein